MLDTHRLRLLREFAERGTIAATAAALGYTPSAVSQQLAALEREAGAVLLDRTARAAELTDAGRRLADHAGRILALVGAAGADLSAAGPAGRGTARGPGGAARAGGGAVERRREGPGRAAPPGEPPRRAVDQLLAGTGGMPPAPWEFEGMSTILSLVARGIGIAALPRLTLAAGDRRVAVRELPGAAHARELYAVARASSVRRPSVAVMLAALDAAPDRLGR